MALVDTHLHLDDEQFAGQRESLVERARAAGISTLITVGTTADSSQESVQLAAQLPGVHAAVGIQPNYCSQAQPGDWDRILALADQPGVVALGETGLDRHWDYSPFELQQDYFDRHLRLSQQTDLPFIVHMRDCGDDILAMLSEARQRGPLRGVMHSFSGDQSLMEACLQLGMYISFAGMVTFKKSDQLRQVAAAVGDDHILIETDAPWLSPHPCRGQRPNEPALLVHTFECLADCRQVAKEQFKQQLESNSRQLFDRLP